MMNLFSFSPDDDRLIKAIRDSGRAELPVGAQQRLVQRLQAEMTSVRKASESRYKERQRSVFNQLTPKPMIAIVIAAIILLTGSGTVIASDFSRPGDTLFGLDQAAERTRLAVTFGDQARARVRADIAEEREQERLELLEDNDSEHAQEAEKLANEALTQAIETISEVRLKLEEKGNPGKAVEALAEVEVRLRGILTLRNRSDEQEAGNDDDETNVNGNTNGNVNDDDSDDDDSLNGNTNRSDDDSDDEDRSNSNRGSDDDDSNRGGDDDQADNNANNGDNDTNDDNDNRNANSNSNRGGDDDDVDEDNSGPGNADDNDTATVERIEVKVEDGRAEIKVRTGGEDDEWQLNTTDQTTILLSISARTGLTAAEIQARWEYDVED